MQQLAKEYKLKKLKVGFVPTMGYLHDGHISLIKRARKDCDIVVISIFVNPSQFGPGEDYKRYPKDFQRDRNIAEKESVDIVFSPCVEEMYPSDFSTHVEVENLTGVLCGISRPGHFKGVTTVVNKLFNIVIPDVAYFGQKDMQQALVIKKMVSNLNMPVEIKVMPIVREKDGLALSSRNKYLNEKERKQALVLYNCIKKAEQMVKENEIEVSKIKTMIKEEIKKKDLVKIDYIEVVDLDNLKGIERIEYKALLALAVYLGNTRLIDNTILKKQDRK